MRSYYPNVINKEILDVTKLDGVNYFLYISLKTKATLCFHKWLCEKVEKEKKINQRE
jgi:hypothetical protein